MSGSRALQLLVVLLAIGALATVATASEVTTRPFCAVCADNSDDRFEATTFESALPANDSTGNAVVHSDLTVRIAPDGTTTWTARNRLASSGLAERLAHNETLRAAVLSRIDFDASPTEEPQNLSLHVENETAVVSFVDEGGASRRFGGVVFLTAHKDADRYQWWQLNAHRVEIAAPAGWAVTAAPDDEYDQFEIRNGSVLWTGDSTDEMLRDTLRRSEAYAFAAERDGQSTLLTNVHRTLGAVPNAIEFTLLFVSVPLLCLFGAVWGIGRRLRGTPPGNSVRRQYYAALSLVAIGGALLLASTSYEYLLPFALQFGLLGCGGYALTRSRSHISMGSIVGIALLSVIVPLAVFWTVAGVEFDSLVMGARDFGTFLCGLFVLAAAFSFGAIASGGSGDVLKPALAVTAGFLPIMPIQAAPSFAVAQGPIAMVVTVVLAALCLLAIVPIAYYGALLGRPVGTNN